jgi:hypothetical protein
MPLEGPLLDNRNYADILQEALARIPVHNPDWTNFNDSDPGVTLLQLFSFMTESILYRANQIPERNRLKFLQLLGIPLRPAAAAKGFITINNERGPLESRPCDAGLDVRAGQVRFRTSQGLEVLPIEARVFFKQALAPPVTDEEIERAELYTQLYADLLDEAGSAPAFYETRPMPEPGIDGQLPVVDLAETVDGCLWLALLARPVDLSPTDLAGSLDRIRTAIANRTLTVGLMPRLDEEGVVVAAGQTNRAESRTPVRWEIASVLPGDPAANYKLLNARAEGAILHAPGLVELTLPAAEELITWNWSELEPGLEGTGEYPPSLADTNFSERVLTWIRLRLDQSGSQKTVKARLSWLGVNATLVQQKILVSGELVGTGSGEPDQCFRLANAPVLPETLVLTVGGEPWQPIDDLLAADPEVPVADPRRPIYQTEATTGATPAARTQVFTLDPESGDICMGDGAHGARPRRGQPLVASYAFGGGRQGNLGLGLINRSPQLPAGYKVTNPLRTWGGDDAQTTASAEKTIPRAVQHRDRLVSVQDFKDVTAQTPGVDLGRVEVLPVFDPTSVPPAPIPGAVTVLVIPATPGFDTPQPDQFFLEAVCDHLQPRRLVTTELYVRGPLYQDIWLSVGLEVLGGHASGPVQEAVRQALFRFLSPLYGGRKDAGWPLNIAVLPQEIEAVVARVDGVRLVEAVLLGTATVDNVLSVPLDGLMLPRLQAVAVSEGAPLPLSQLRSAPPVAGLSDGQRWTPIPVLAEQC